MNLVKKIATPTNDVFWGDNHAYSRQLDADIFNWQGYLAHDQVLANWVTSTFGNQQRFGAEWHWLNYGVNEGRRGSGRFSARYYLVHTRISPRPTARKITRGRSTIIFSMVATKVAMALIRTARNRPGDAAVISGSIHALTDRLPKGKDRRPVLLARSVGPRLQRASCSHCRSVAAPHQMKRKTPRQSEAAVALRLPQKQNRSQTLSTRLKNSGTSAFAVLRRDRFRLRPAVAGLRRDRGVRKEDAEISSPHVSFTIRNSEAWRKRFQSLRVGRGFSGRI